MKLFMILSANSLLFSTKKTSQDLEKWNISIDLWFEQNYNISLIIKPNWKIKY